MKNLTTHERTTNLIRSLFVWAATQGDDTVSSVEALDSFEAWLSAERQSVLAEVKA